MSYSTVNNASDTGKLKGTGRKGKAQSGAEQELFWADEDFEFASKSAALDIANWNAGVSAGQLHYIGVIEEFDQNDTEATFYESPNGNYRAKTSEAQKVRQYRLIEGADTHAALTSFDGQNGRLFIRTSRGYLKAKLEAGKVVGLKTSQFDVGFQTAATSESPAFTPIEVTFANPRDDEQSYFEDKIDFEFSEVDQVFNIELSASSVSSSGSALDFTLSAVEESSDVAVAGITTSNLKAYDENGNSLTIASVSANGDNYDVSITTALTGGVYIEVDGTQDIGGVLYVSEEITIAV